jgi:hypothetical protein
LFTVAVFRAVFHAVFRPFLRFLPGFFFPFSIRGAKRVENLKKNRVLHAILEEIEKKGHKKGPGREKGLL